jgi:hypothetical protein
VHETPFNLTLTSLGFPWAAGSTKRPNNCFRAANSEKPPRPHTGANFWYPNFTIQVAKLHQSWDRLIADVVTKHFSPMTGIVVWLGIKISPSRKMRVCLLERDLVQGFGALDPPPLAHTDFIDVTAPCTESVVIPKRLLYHRVPVALVPPTVTPDNVLDLNIIREAIDECFGV